MSIATASKVPGTVIAPTGTFAVATVHARTKSQAIRKARHSIMVEGFRIIDVSSAVEQFEGEWRVEVMVVPR